jgi:hypothetical protein
MRHQKRGAMSPLGSKAERLAVSISRLLRSPIADMQPMARPRWSVDIIRKRGEHLGTVEAKDEKEAIAKATEDRSDQQPISIFCQGFMPTMLPGAPQTSRSN